MNQTADNATLDADTAPEPPTSLDGRPYAARYRFYILMLLAVTYTLNTADRGILSILIPPIKEEFGLKDWQIGVLAGPIFALVYATCSLPFASLSDRMSRRNLIAGTMAVFSAATAFCGLSTSYLQLAAGRFLTGSAESATVPAATSLIADLYPPEKRVSAIAIFTAGGTVGGTVAGLVGGIVAHNFGWREAFFVAGVPGILLALAMFLTVREPRRAVSRALSARRKAASMGETVKHLASQPAFVWLCTGNTLLFFRGGGFGAFDNLFLVQTHGLNLQEIGAVHTVQGFVGLAVTLYIGRLVDKLALKDIRWFMYVPTIVSLAALPFGLTLLLSPIGWVALVVGGSSALFALCYAAPLYAAAQALVPNSMRARAIAILLLLTMLLGTGFGAPVAGLLSDFLAQSMGKEEGLRWALMIMLTPNLLAAFVLLARRDDLAGGSSARGGDGARLRAMFLTSA